MADPFPFPFAGAGIAAARKYMGVYVQFVEVVPKARRELVAAGVPRSLGDKPRWSGNSLVVAHDGDSLAWVVRAEYEAADRYNDGELASDAQWEAFAAATDAWLLAMHARAPIACVVRAIDQEYGTITSAWHDWSLPRMKVLELPEWVRETVAEMRPTPKPAKPAKTTAPKPKQLDDEIWSLSYLGEPFVLAMAYHAQRGEPHLEATAFWAGIAFMPRTFPHLVDRAKAKQFGKPPADIADRFAHWLRPWLEPRFTAITKVKADDLIRWYVWCQKIQSPELDALHGRIEAELLRRDHGDVTPALKHGFCPFCGADFEVAYVGAACVGARCTATNTRMSRGVADFLHRNMFAPKPSGKAFNKMIAQSPSWFCARCGKRHSSRKSAGGYTVALQCKACKHGYTDGLITGLFQSMADRHARAPSMQTSTKNRAR